MRSKRHVLASNGYLELGMFDATAHKRRREVLEAAIAVYLGAREWHKAVATAADLVKAEPKNSTHWIILAYAVNQVGDLEQTETVLLKARLWHPRNSLILFKLACCASARGHIEEAKVRLGHAIDVDSNVRRLALDNEDLRPLWDWIGRVA
jgi:Flp pilus assembly protein TadD